MDKKKNQRSKSPRQSSRTSGVDQLALAQQLGIPPEFLDPSLMAAYGMDPQQMLNPMAAAAAGYPFVNPAALQAFAGLGALGGQAGSSMHAGAVDWWNIAQNQALASAGFYPGMLPPGFASLASNDMSQKPKSSSSDAGAKSKACTRKPTDHHTQRTSSPFSTGKSSPRPGSSGTSMNRLQQDRKRSSDSQQSGSKETPGGKHGLNSPFHSAHTKHSSLAPGASWNDGLNNQHQQKLSEQMFQAEIMRQLEQQFLVQQLQMQQQQQDQLNAVLQSVMTGSNGSLPGSSSSNRKEPSDAGKSQQQMTAMLQQLMQGGGASSSSGLPQGISSAFASSLFSAPGALEAMMAMNQMGNINAISALAGTKQAKQEEQLDQGHKSPSTSHKSYQSSSKDEKLYSPSSQCKPGTSSPHKSNSRSGHGHSSKNVPVAFPGVPGVGLSPDNALLAALYSQQLQQQQQYEALIKQEMEAVNRLREHDAKSGSRDSLKSRPRVKQEPHLDIQALAGTSKHEFATPSAHNRANLYSPANSVSSRGKSHTSPTRDSSQSPSRRFQAQERSQSHGSASSSTIHHSPSRSGEASNSAKKSKHSLINPYGHESMSETLKLFSTLASNPNLTQRELAALMSLPPGTDPSALLPGMNALGGLPLSAAGRLLDTQATGQMSPSELEKLNKDIAAALAFETQRLEEQFRHKKLQMDSKPSKKEKEDDNHISVIHQNNVSEDTSKQTSSSNDKEFSENVDKKELLETRIGNGDAGSSDCDAVSENSADRNLDSPSENHTRKRRRVITDEEEVMEPLKHGWKREVRFKFLGNQLRGEVLYISPSGKKFRTYPDVLKHLEENNITNLHRDNFSFSSRLRIGSFYEQTDKASRQWIKMTEEELDQRIKQLDGYRGASQSPAKDNADQSDNYSSSSKSDTKQSKKEEEQARDKHAERMKLMRQQEKLQKMEQQRIEREIRERIAMEERQKLEETRKLKYQEALLKAKELERQRMAEALDRDHRRQQILLMRALESRKRAEERERRREEIRIEKMLQREKKMEQRRIAMQIARELKMPVEDRTTIGAPDLPQLTQLQGTLDNKCPHQLSGNACADLLMVLEFVKTFKDCLRIEEAIVPTFEQLQRGLLNDPSHTPALVQVTMTLLHQCLCDPGVPAPGPWLHCLTGVKVTDIDVADDNYSEILRLFIWARNGYKTEIALRLETLPFPSLTTDEKAQSLAFLVNELVCSRPICMEIEKNLDALATLRRDKWMVEGQMRQLRVAHEKCILPDSLPIRLEDDEASNSSTSPRKSLVKNGNEIVKEEPKVETGESLFQKKMEELTQQHNSYNTQLVHNSKPLRALDLGQDRYKRRYWVLPNLGGVYVEGLESGISYEDDEESPDEEEEEAEEEKGDKETTKTSDENCEKTEVAEEKSDEINSETPSNENIQSAESEAEKNADGVMTESPVEDGLNAAHSTDEVDISRLADDVELDKSQDTSTEGQDDSKYKTEIASNAAADPNVPETSTAENTVQSSAMISNETTDVADTSTPPSEDTVSSTVPFPPPCPQSHSNKENTGNTHEGSSVPTAFLGGDLENSNTTRPTSSCDSSGAFQDHDAVGDFDLCDNIDDDSIDVSYPGSGNPDVSRTSDKLDLGPDLEENTHNYATSPVLQSHAPPNKQTTPAAPDLRVGTEKNVPSPKRPDVMPDSKENEDMAKFETDDDSVIVATKAVVAAAEASSSHILFSKTNETGAKSSTENEAGCATDENKSSENLSENGTNTPLIGTHTINALVQMGVNPTSLTSQQLEVLSHLDIPVPSTEVLTPTTSSTATDKNTEVENGPQDVCTEPESKKEVSDAKSVTEKESGPGSLKQGPSADQDAPMDLSCPANTADRDVSVKKIQKVPALSGTEGTKFSSASPFQSLSSAFTSPARLGLVDVKQEQYLTEHRSPFTPSQDSSETRYGDNKFFVPIAFSNNIKMDHGFGPQNYNQIISSCPSPNTLANFIVSTASYSQFPSLEDIKFPIRAPDVKEEPDAIPRDKKRGWWRMESESELRSLSEKLHLRGIREKQLHRNITKNFEVCTSSMTDAASPVHKFAVFMKASSSPESVEKEEKMTDVEKVKKTTRSSSQERKNDDTNFSPAEKTAYESEMRVLIQVEELSVRCCNMAVISPQWRTDNPRPSMCRKDLTHVPLGPIRDSLGNDIKFDITNPIKHDPRSALGAAVDLLGCLERGVCRRYLKPPLVRKGGATEFSSLPSLSESGAMDVAAGLRTWRNAVAASASASQLSLCVRMLEMCIAWDRSANSPVKAEPVPVPKVKKSKGQKRPNAKSLLELDGAAQPKKKRKKRTNTNKNSTKNPGSVEGKKSKQSRMPIDTADVISKAVPGSSEETSTNEREVLVNGDKVYEDSTSQFSTSTTLSSINNFDDSMASVESGMAHNNLAHEFADALSPHTEYHTNSDNVSEEYKPNAEMKKKKKKKKAKKMKSSKSDEEKKSNKEKKKLDKDTVMCRDVLRELQSHEAATWFLFPVDCKVVPGYRKIIKKPIDFHTIECRLKKGRYKSLEDFVAEVRLVFDNCQKFNEDDSNIGRAGHNIREFFERRWAEVAREKYSAPNTVNATSTVPVPPTNSIAELEVPEPETQPSPVLETPMEEI